MNIKEFEKILKELSILNTTNGGYYLIAKVEGVFYETIYSKEKEILDKFIIYINKLNITWMYNRYIDCEEYIVNWLMDLYDYFLDDKIYVTDNLYKVIDKLIDTKNFKKVIVATIKDINVYMNHLNMLKDHCILIDREGVSHSLVDGIYEKDGVMYFSEWDDERNIILITDDFKVKYIP